MAAIPSDAAGMNSGRFGAGADKNRQLLHSREADRSITVPDEPSCGVEASTPDGSASKHFGSIVESNLAGGTDDSFVNVDVV
jgi:hypothetical protein